MNRVKLSVTIEVQIIEANYMKKKSYPLKYLSVIKYILLTCGFMIFNKLENQIFPYSTALFSAAINLNCSLIISLACFILSAVIQGAYGMLLVIFISSFFLILTKLIYAKFRIKVKLELAVFTAISLIGYLILGDSFVYTSFEKRIAVILITSFLSPVIFIAGKAIGEKNIKIKLSYEELASIAVCIVAMGLGTCNLISPYVWKGFSVFCILCACYLFYFGYGTYVSALFGISLAIYYGDVKYLAAIMLIGIVADGFSNLTRYAAAAAVPLCDYLTELIFGVYGDYVLIDFLPVVTVAAIFIVIPSKPLSAVKEKISSFREKQLTRTTINRNRLMLSNRLYELSRVFTEMAWAFSALKKNGASKEKSKSAIAKEIKTSVCRSCPNFSSCRKYTRDTDEELHKMIDVGFAKGKISLIDVPSFIGERCIKLSEITFGLNKMLAEYRTFAIGAENLATGRQLIAEEAEGISDILRGLALESGVMLKYQNKLEKKIASELLKNGFLASELLIYGENERITVCLVLATNDFSVKKLQTLLSRVMGFAVALIEKVNITEEKCYLSFRRAPEYDAVFGIAKTTKDGSSTSGDTYAVTRISEDKFLVALSDGMGSGTNAEAISSVSLSLIESFYKAGMESDLILNTVNKLLSVNAEDSFTALDVSVIDLKTCNADFIKYGSPYGFIVSENGIRIIEGNTLPLGILEELKPSVCTTALADGDVIVLTTDGISDAFGSSQEVIDFLRKIPAKNPQTLADGILNRAIEISDGFKRDDMSVLAVRVYKKAEELEG